MDHKHIRNFVVISHIDHGKSTLADRFLELTGTVDPRKMHAQYLDTMPLEQERGITIKMAPVRMHYTRTNADHTQTNADNEGSVLIYPELTYQIRGAIFRVKKAIGLGHKEIIYQRALEEEFIRSKIKFEKEKIITVTYGDEKVGVYRPDFIIDDKVILEIKAVPFLGKLEARQIWEYLRGSSYPLALLVNFGNSVDVQIKRIVYDTAREVTDSPRKSASSPRESAYTLNLIDTPGHVDFSYEVSRALAAVEGAILLVDATKGIQAQTMANLRLAQKQGLVIVPAVNKIDLPNARTDDVQLALAEIVGMQDPNEVLRVSAKDGTGVDELLKAVIERVPPPGGKPDAPLRALIFDSRFDPFLGVIAYVRIVDGSAKKGNRLAFLQVEAEGEALECGIFSPERTVTGELATGEIGWIATGLKDIRKCRVGDTITTAISHKPYALSRKQNKYGLQPTAYSLQQGVEALPGYQEPKPVVFASFYPEDLNQFDALRDALEKLKLNDAALQFQQETSSALGRGFRCGFLGMLHLEIVLERIRREYGVAVIVTRPHVEYRVRLQGSLRGQTQTKTQKDAESQRKSALSLRESAHVVIRTPQEWPDASTHPVFEEPWVKLEIFTPVQYLGQIGELLRKSRGLMMTHAAAAGISHQLIVHAELPLAEIMSDFADQLKSVSSGWASFSYESVGYREADLVKLDILIAGDEVPELAVIVPNDRAYMYGRDITKKLKTLLPHEQFAVSLQAAIGGKIIARESIPAARKDVTGYLYGGDYTRKRKLLEKQKRGKKRLKTLGHVRIKPEVFLALLKR